MAPNTRANSKPNTPVKDSTPASFTEGEGTPTPSRKAPRCSKCQRPRAGHPRSGCPFVDNNTADDDTTTPVTNVTETLRSMNISKSDVLGASDDQETDAGGSDIILAARPKARRSTGRRSLTGRPPPAEDFEIEDTKAVIRERRRSERAARKSFSKPGDLASLDSTSAELVSKLLIPKAEGTEEEAEGQQKLEKSVHWEDRAGNGGEGSNGKGKDRKLRIAMPCSFQNPSPYSSTASLQTEDATAAIDDKAAVVASISSQGSVTSADSDLTLKAKALSRTMSMEERHSFLEKLNQLSNVQVYVLNSADVNDIRTPKGLYTRLIPADDAHPEENIFIVGKDEKETEKCYQTMKNEREASLRKDRRGSGGLKAATGGVLVGAVATFAGLAYA